MTIFERITPILRDTYGKGSMVDSLAQHLAEKIDGFEPRDADVYGDNQREDMIRLTCWNWFSGGSTAESAARKIEQVLDEPGDQEDG